MDEKNIVTLGGGCFWCTEAIFKRIKGILTVVSGYSGGERANPTYLQVTTGATGHAEAIQLTFDPSIISYEKILDIFWHLHDPTTLNQQGADVGTQYRSVIFYHTEEQKKIAIASHKKMQESHYYKDEIITEILPFQSFYNAEDYHQNYYEENQMQPYCSLVISPKIKKLLELYNGDIKDQYKS